MALPGDWHTGLNASQSIFKIFYKPLLHPLQDLLGWKRINEAVSRCYYQATRLIKFVNEELHRFLMQQFVASRWERFKAMFQNDTISNNDVYCKISHEYQQYLREIEDRDIDGEDEFLKMCALFLHMSDEDLFLFIQSYRSADSIATIKWYDWFVAAWTALGQNKYVAAYHEQIDMLLVKFTYRRYVESLLNWTVRTHPASSGKGCVAQDEYLELCNRLFTQFPKMRTLRGMIRIALFVGLAQRCKKFCQQFYVKKSTNQKRNVTKAGSHANQTPERQAVY